MTRIVLLASGTRGDVQPYAALGRALLARGYEAVLATHPPFRALAERAGLTYAELADNPSDLLAASPGALTLRAPLSTLRYLRAARPALTRLIDSAWHACVDHNATAIVAGLPALWASGLAEALQVPLIWGLLQPLTTTRNFPSSIAPLTRDLGAWLNARSYDLVDAATWLPWRDVVNCWRRAHGLALQGGSGALKRMNTQGQTVLYGFSESLVPRPDDWPAHCVITGFWRTAQITALPDEVRCFLASADNVIYLGTGAGSALAPGQLLAQAQRVLERLDLRALVNIDGIDVVPAAWQQRFCLAQGVDHTALFPQMRAVVHHGGAGTSAAAAHAGVPTVVLPVFADQFFWAQRISALGAGIALPQARINMPTFERALSAVITQPAYRDSAQRLAAALAFEDGAARAADVITAAL